MATRARWTSLDQREAMREGWCVILSEERGEEIQRDDEDDEQEGGPRFADDEAALAHVRACAAAGSRLHRAALEYVGEPQEEAPEPSPEPSTAPRGAAEGWRAWGTLPERFQLMRRRQRARWWDQEAQAWVGPEQANVAPAIAWALWSREAPPELRAQVREAPRVPR